MIYIIEPNDNGRYQALLRELLGLEKRGLKFQVQGIPSTPQHVAKVCTKSRKKCYMRDYVADSSGRIRFIDFNPVKI